LRSLQELTEQLLLEVALATEGNLNQIVRATLVAEGAGLYYRPGWVTQVARSWRDAGCLELRAHLEGDVSVQITARGMQVAETLAHKHGFALHELMAQRRATGKPTLLLKDTPASESVVRLQGSEASAELCRALPEIIEWLQEETVLTQEGDMKAQRLSELHAGTIILKGPQTSAGVLEALVLVPLRWVADRTADHALERVVVAALTAAISLAATATRSGRG
jgi:hypothetical protein